MTKENITPLRDMIAIRVIEDATKTETGIILAGQKDKKPSKGEVVAVGPGTYKGEKFVPCTCVVGDIVLFGKFASDHATKINDEIIIIAETEIMCIIK